MSPQGAVLSNKQKIQGKASVCMGVLQYNAATSSEARLLKQRSDAMPRDDPSAEALLCGEHFPFDNRFSMTISQHLRFTPGEFTTALARKLGLVIPQLLTAVGMPLSRRWEMRLATLTLR